MRSLGLALLLVCPAPPALAHDVGVDLLGNLTTSSATNPRVGSAGLSLSGSVDFSDRWTGFLLATYLRDFATRTPESASSGTNVFLFSGGALFIPTEHLLFMATVMGSPPVVQRNATTFSYAGGSADVVVRGTNWNLGGSLLGSWASNGLSRWEHTVDVTVGVNHLESAQVAELGTTVRARLYRLFCERNPGQGYCPLVNGVDSRLTQVRLAAAYTATLFSKTDVALELAGFLYDTSDPLSVGSFSAVIAGRQGPELGAGVPLAPWRLTVRPGVLHRFRSVSVRLGYQLGLYVGDVGTNHLVSLRVQWKVTPSVRLSASVLAQADLDRGAFVAPGGSAALGVLFLF